MFAGFAVLLACTYKGEMKANITIAVRDTRNAAIK
jgi:hypothetical protein